MYVIVSVVEVSVSVYVTMITWCHHMSITSVKSSEQIIGKALYKCLLLLLSLVKSLNINKLVSCQTALVFRSKTKTQSIAKQYCKVNKV